MSESKKVEIEEKFAFWYRISEEMLLNQNNKTTIDKSEYENQVKKIAEFDNIDDFWAIFQHLRKPDSCKPGIEFMMFKDKIKPMWEDENNKNGGRITIKLRKDFTTIIWEEMIFALIGGVLPKEIKEIINGIVVSSKKEINTLQIWFRVYDEKNNSNLAECIRDLLQIPKEVYLDIKQFNYNPMEKKGYNNKRISGGYYNNSHKKNYNFDEINDKNKDDNI